MIFSKLHCQKVLKLKHILHEILTRTVMGSARIRTPESMVAAASSCSGCGVQGQGVGFKARVWGSGSGCGVQGQGVRCRVRVWGSGSGCWVQGKGVGFSVRVWGSVSGYEVQEERRDHWTQEGGTRPSTCGIVEGNTARRRRHECVGP